MPRTTRAQAMDALSTMASIAGYKAVLITAIRCREFCHDDHRRRNGDPQRVF